MPPSQTTESFKNSLFHELVHAEDSENDIYVFLNELKKKGLRNIEAKQFAEMSALKKMLAHDCTQQHKTDKSWNAKLLCDRLIDMTYLSASQKKHAKAQLWESGYTFVVAEPESFSDGSTEGFMEAGLPKLLKTMRKDGIYVMAASNKDRSITRVFIHDTAQQQSGSEKILQWAEVGASEKNASARFKALSASFAFCRILDTRVNFLSAGSSWLQQNKDSKFKEGISNEVLACDIHCYMDAIDGLCYRMCALIDKIRNVEDLHNNANNAVYQLYANLFGAYFSSLLYFPVFQGQIKGEPCDGQDISEHFKDLLNNKDEGFSESIFLGKKNAAFKSTVSILEKLLSANVDDEGLREAMRIWFDRMGGLIMLADELREVHDKKSSNFHMNLVFAYFGDAILCAELMAQALKAEKLLQLGGSAIEIFGKNFLNSKIAIAEHFALNVLPRSEGHAEIIRRNSDCFRRIILP